MMTMKNRDSESGINNEYARFKVNIKYVYFEACCFMFKKENLMTTIDKTSMFHRNEQPPHVFIVKLNVAFGSQF